MHIESLKRYTKITTSTISRYLLGLNKNHNITHLTFEVTNLCNSKCEMCNIWANQDNSGQLSIEQIRTVFKDKSLRNLESVILTGGEVFLRDDIVEIVESIWTINYKVRISLSTNGILPEKVLDVANKLAAKKIPIIYGVSLDGVGVKHDNRRRIPGNFVKIDEILLPGLKSLSPDLVSIGIGHCLDDYGSDTFEELRAYCEINEVGLATQMIEDFDYYLPSQKQSKSNDGDWSKIHFHKLGFEGENRLLKKEIYADRTKYNNIINKLPASVHHNRLINVINGNDSIYECSSFRNFFLLKYDGSVTPCLRFCTQVLGNVKEYSLTEILDSNQRLSAVNEILKCNGCLNTWCTDWSMEKNAWSFKKEILKWLLLKFSDKKKSKYSIKY